MLTVNRGRYIGVAGNMGSGKTTLTQHLARAIGWSAEQRRYYDSTYVADQLQTPERWSFEAQIAFLAGRVRSIRNAVDVGLQVVVDRTPLEDAFIFGRYWAMLGKMDLRASATYELVSGAILESLAPPSAIVYLSCDAETSAKRLAARPRAYQALYPADHLTVLQEMYAEWFASLTVPKILVDTTRSDVRDPRVAQAVGEELARILTVDEPTQPMLPVFSEQSAAPTIGAPRSGARRGTNFSPAGGPSVYIAAGFTAHETSDDAAGEESATLVPTARPHGKLPDQYRSQLRSVSRAFTDLGYVPVLPHRDVNGWGTLVLQPRDVAEACLRLVDECSIFFGILGTSYGGHAETGAAIALRKPTIIVRVGGVETSFGRGMALHRSVVSVSVPTLAAVPALVRSERFAETMALAVRRSREPR